MRRIVAVLVVLSSVCCAGLPSPGLVRNAQEQWNAGVLVTARCPNGDGQAGTGYIVSGAQVITARHVVMCGDHDEIAAANVWVDAGDGKRLPADVEISVVDDDLVRLLVDPDSFVRWLTPISVGPPPPVGERVCWVATRPRPTYRCGTSQGLKSDGRLYFDGFIEQGNSGSPVHDSAGRLVGTLRAANTCQGGVNCLGQAIPMQGREWLLP